MPKISAIRLEAEQLVRNNPQLAYAVARVIEEIRDERGDHLMGLTPLQRRLLDFLQSYIDRAGIAPSYTEICEHVGIARSNVATVLHRLKERGYVSFIKNKSRTVTILPAARELSSAGGASQRLTA
jgi:CRP-like cAMP-binding protein